MKIAFAMTFIIIFLIILSVEVNSEVSFFNGTTLYVGGSGPGNYTTIQSAIDAALDNDTVFVYQHSTPYRENIVILKSILFMGENQGTELLGLDPSLSTILIRHSFVTITNFGFADCDSTDISVQDSSCIKISKCFFKMNNQGIVFENISNSQISENHILSSYEGSIYLSQSTDNNINDNFIFIYSDSGIIIKNNSKNNNIYNNNITEDARRAGIQIYNNAGLKNKIYNNNFHCDVWSNVRSYWNDNYYQYRIVSQIPFFPKIIPLHFYLNFFSISFDFHPVQEPYNLICP